MSCLFSLKQLKSIHVHIQPEQTKGSERPRTLATVQSENPNVAQPDEKNCRVVGLNVIHPQIIQIHPVTGTGSQQFPLQNPSEPPVQLLLQRSFNPLVLASVDTETTQKMLNGHENKSATVTSADSPNVTQFSAHSASSFTNQETTQRFKRSLKVKTRSGRISRPPKYKAKDYKFIKMEDMADGHQSDSDDYSELSVDGDDEGKEKEVPSLFVTLNDDDLRPKLFKCETCEKSYIGRGGLARHYKLHPGHEQQGSSQSSLMNRPLKMALPEGVGKTSDNTHQCSLLPQTVTLIDENALVIDLEKHHPAKSEQQVTQTI